MYQYGPDLHLPYLYDGPGRVMVLRKSPNNQWEFYQHLAFGVTEADFLQDPRLNRVTIW